MEETFQPGWRVVALPFVLTAIVICSALGFAFS